MRTRSLGALVVALLMVSACADVGSSLPSPDPVTGPSSLAPAASTAASGEVVEVTVGTDIDTELVFDPLEVSVPAGAHVRLTFENRSTLPHNLTFQEPIAVATSPIVTPGSSEALEFRAPDPDEYVFVCTLHPGMEAKLIVEGR